MRTYNLTLQRNCHNNHCSLFCDLALLPNSTFLLSLISRCLIFCPSIFRYQLFIFNWYFFKCLWYYEYRKVKITLGNLPLEIGFNFLASRSVAWIYLNSLINLTLKVKKIVYSYIETCSWWQLSTKAVNSTRE